MEPLALVRCLSAVPRRAACSDAERRAARVLRDALRAQGRRHARIRTFWVRPSWEPVHVLLAWAGVTASLLAVDHPRTGVAIAAAALALLAGELTGRATPLRLLTFARATQNVVALDPRTDAPVRLVVTAAVDAPRPGLLERGAVDRAWSRARRRLRGHLPGPHGVHVAALVAVAACGVARAQGAGGWVGPVQLVPTVVLLALGGAFLDAWTARAPRAGANADASAAAVALALVAALDRRPPRHLAVDVVLAGAGEAHALGMRRFAAERRRAGLRAEEVAVLHLEPCGAGVPAWWTRDGLALPLRFHPRLVALAAGVAADERHLGARAHETRRATGARAARAAGWPALAIGAVDADGAVPRRGEDADVPESVDAAAMDACLALALGVVGRLDAELGQGRASSV